MNEDQRHLFSLILTWAISIRRYPQNRCWPIAALN